MINIAYRCFVVVTFNAQSFSSGGNLNCAVSGEGILLVGAVLVSSA